MGWFPAPGFTPGECQHCVTSLSKWCTCAMWTAWHLLPCLHTGETLLRWAATAEMVVHCQGYLRSSALGPLHSSTWKVTWERKNLSHPISENASINLIQMWTGHWREMDTIKAQFTWPIFNIFLKMASFSHCMCQLPSTDCQESTWPVQM